MYLLDNKLLTPLCMEKSGLEMQLGLFLNTEPFPTSCITKLLADV